MNNTEFTSSQKPPIEIAPENMPRLNSTMAINIGYFIFRLSGWRYRGEIPNVNKLLAAAAPHTSNWDFIIAVPIILALGLKATIMMKKEAFLWPIDKLWRWMGFIPTDRSGAKGNVSAVVDHFNNSDKLWFVLAPEGTRSLNTQWKTGFLNIAHQAQVPVLLVSWDYPSKTVTFGPLFKTSGDNEKDLADIRAHFGQFIGRHPHLQG